MKETLLLIDDDSDAAQSLAKALPAYGVSYAICVAISEEKALEQFQSHSPNVVVLDLSLNDREGVESGFRMLRTFVQSDSSCRVIVLTGHGSLENGVRALQYGAASFLEKPADMSHLAALILDGFEQSRLRRSFLQLQENTQHPHTATLLGKSEAMRQVRESLEYAAATSQPILITGETGTGKGVCAKLIHTMSSRRESRFVRYQPGLGNDDLVGSELFGHKKGAFTGAEADRQGLFSLAEGGTLFLDEIDELPSAVQVSLLGVLQENVFRPLGAEEEEGCSFRLIAATNCDIAQALSSGKLRDDLFHRLAHCEIVLPPLRERKEDIPILADHFLRVLCEKEGMSVTSFEEGALALLDSYDWPGNVRELEACVENAAYRANFQKSPAITPAHVQLRKDAHASCTGSSESFHEQVQAFKTRLIEEALGRNGGNQVKAARELGLDRSSMRRILAK
ncbi:MAG: sigma-54-dependent Fis family transcriptional regulator [Bdellovibrionales bacterium]|nr:sigma-54-dependent Fis family transcriptional regulator [Bdellovibrionales bacterium]